MPIPLRSNLLLALSYAIAGWGALQIAVPPGYAAPLFPPAGIALCALLVGGLRYSPGVFAGSLLVQVLAAANSGVHGFALLGIVLPALGATMQAMVGYFLARRLLGVSNGLDSQESIVRFVVVVAPLGCVVGATVGTSSLIAMAAIPGTDALFTWVNWWAGDTLGVLVMLPLLLVFFGRPASDWRTRRLAVAGPMVIALVLLSFTFIQVRDWEANRLQSQFNRDAEHLASLIRKRLDAQLDQMLALERLATVTPVLDADTWQRFVLPLMSRYPGTQNFGWSPLIKDEGRNAFEARAGRAHSGSFRILGRDRDGRTFVAGRKAEYLPILFVEPFELNRSVLGLDPLVLDKTAEAALRARETGLPVATESIRLVQEQGEQRGVVVYQAVFSSNPVRQVGMVSGVFRMDDAMNATLAGHSPELIDVCLTEIGSGGQSQRLYGPPGCAGPAWLGGRLHWQTRVGFAGRQWLMVVSATPAYMAKLRSWGVWLTLAAGLLSTGILGAFLLLSSGRTRRVETVVMERTQQLAETSQRLREQQHELAEAQRIARIGSWEKEEISPALFCSAELLSMFRLQNVSEVTEASLLERIREEDRPALARALQQVTIEAAQVALDCQLIDDLPEPRILHFRIESERRNAGSLHIHGTAQDVTDTRAAEAHIAYLAHYDMLTGLPNRTQWNERVQAELRSAARHGDMLALLFLDLDHFKSVNDSLGHAVGDHLLFVVAQRLFACLRENDFMARLGGDEFVILLPRLEHREDAALVAQKLLAELHAPIVIDVHELTTSASIGIAIYPDDGDDVSTLLKNADVAMYGAKDKGRNAFHYFIPEMNGHALELLLLENALRRAIERDELLLHFQPQVTAQGEVAGCEALVRWQRPEVGLVMPDDFISVAEKSGIILALGEWVLEAACRQQATWASQGRRLVMAVNISALQFRQAGFDEMVRRILDRTGVDPLSLELELTESALMQPTPDVVERMARLRIWGIRLALDDFGTGYSSLSHLKRLPIQRLKIDRSFVKDLPHDQEDATIAAATLSLARDLGMEVVAEGVENPAQQAFLTARNCPVMQGYLFSKPLPADAFAAWMDARKT